MRDLVGFEIDFVPDPHRPREVELVTLDQLHQAVTDQVTPRIGIVADRVQRLNPVDLLEGPTEIDQVIQAVGVGVDSKGRLVGVMPENTTTELSCIVIRVQSSTPASANRVQSSFCRHTSRAITEAVTTGVAHRFHG